VQYTIFGPLYGEVGGSGFIYKIEGKTVIITNYHVVENTVNISVTLQNGDASSAQVLGSDPYADLAVLEIAGETDMLKPLNITSSSTLKVGDPVIAIGNPFRLSGSMTTGIVSQLGRTIQESTAGSFSIANIIQISTPINPGNSGGPLLNYHGDVVGITTAIVADSQGVGFAIPSSTVLKEVPSLIATGDYTQHAWMGVTGVDMSYDLAKAMDINTTYGWLIASVVDGGPADTAGLRGSTDQIQIGGSWKPLGGDLIVAIDGTSIVTGDDMMSYLEEHTLPGQTIDIAIIRDDHYITIQMELGVRPPPAT
jgi:S1-C subfamily serine protease